MNNRWQEALTRLKGSDLLQLGMDADAVREQLWPERVVTYTNGFTLQPDLNGTSWVASAEAAIDRGARGFLISLLEPALDEQAISALHQRFPDISLTGTLLTDSNAPSGTSATTAGTGFTDLRSLCAAGLATVVIDTGFPDWQAVHRAAHQAGLLTTAILILRSSDSPEEWVSLLEAVSSLQDETQGILACEPRIEHLDRALDEVTGSRYLQFLAITRIYLPHIPHLQADWSIFGPKVLQLALRFGADDAGLVITGARDPRSPSHHSGEEELRRIIRDAGFAASPRNATYSQQFLY